MTGFESTGSGQSKKDGSAELAFHSLAEILPLAAADEIAELAGDIGKNGLRFPIVLFEGQILDGRLRYLACQQAGVDSEFEDFHGDDPLAYVISANFYRRHLNESQRAMVAAKVANLSIGANQHSEGTPIGIASSLMNVSARSAARARYVLRSENPALVAAVEAGEITVSAAAERARHVEAHLPSHEADHVLKARVSMNSGEPSVHCNSTPTDGSEGDDKIAVLTGEGAEPIRPPDLRNFPTSGVTVVFGGPSSAVMPVTISIAARVSAGELWPDRSWPDPRNVIWVAGWPHANTRLRSLFAASDADLSRMRFVDPEQDGLGLPIRNLEHDLMGLKCEPSDPSACVVFDYVSEYVDDRNVENSIGRLRPAIEKMKAIADDLQISIVIPLFLPGRDPYGLSKASNELGSSPNIETLLRVDASALNRGALVPLKGTGSDQSHAFFIRRSGGLPVVRWSALADD
jgi:hypothetical protein